MFTKYTDKKVVSLLISIILMIFIVSSDADEIHLKNGRVIDTDSYWEENDRIAYEMFGATIYIDKSKIKKIVTENENEVSQKKSHMREKQKKLFQKYNTNGGAVILKNGDFFVAKRTWYQDGVIYCETEKGSLYFKPEEISQIGSTSTNSTLVHGYDPDSVPPKPSSTNSIWGHPYDPDYVPPTPVIDISDLNCPYSCSQEGQLQKMLLGIDLFTADISSYSRYHSAEMNKLPTYIRPKYKNGVQVRSAIVVPGAGAGQISPLAKFLVKVRVMAEDLLNSGKEDKYGRIKQYYNKILKIIPCCYYKNCSKPMSVDSDFMQDWYTLREFEANYKKTWLKIKKKNEYYKRKSEKDFFEEKCLELIKSKYKNFKIHELENAFRLAIEAYATKNYKEAIALFSICIKKDFETFDALVDRGNSYYYLGGIQWANSLNKKRKKTTSGIANYQLLYRYAGIDLDRAIALGNRLGDKTGVAYLYKANLNWRVYGSDEKMTLRYLDIIINRKYTLKSEALYNKAIILKRNYKSIAANNCMVQSADLKYPAALKILSENPLWPNK